MAGVRCGAGKYCPGGSATYLSATEQRCDVALPSSTSLEGAGSVDDCVCTASHYRRTTGNVSTCVECMEGVNCEAQGEILTTLLVRPGYWRQTEGSEGEYIQKCFNDAVCVGGRNTTAEGTTCLTGQRGPFCSVCDAPKYYGGTESKPCKPCEGDTGLAFVPVVTLGVFVVLLLIIFIRGGKSSLGVAAQLTESISSGNVSGAVSGIVISKTEGMVSDAYDGEIQKSRKYLEGGGETSKGARGAKSRCVVFMATLQRVWGKFQVKLKILISLVQIIDNLGFTFSIPYPTFFESWMSSIGGVFQVELPQMMPLDCIFPMNFYGKLYLRTLAPLVVYFVMFVSARLFKRLGKPWQADALIDGIFFIAFLIYPSTASKLFSVFICEDIEDGTGRLRVDFSIVCSDYTGGYTADYMLMRAYVMVMIGVYVVGTPATYAYLFFVSYRKELLQLQAQELADFHKRQLEGNAHLSEAEKAALVPFGTEERVDAMALLPGYMRKLTSGYEYRTYWFEIFESLRKVALVGVPACFPGRGGNAQLIWGLLVCFFTFGAYMMWAPFIHDSDDQLQQLAQLQIFLTLVASIGLRMTPPDNTVATIMSGLMVCIPIMAVLMETPLVDELRGLKRMCRKHVVARVPAFPRTGRSKKLTSVTPDDGKHGSPGVTEIRDFDAASPRGM